LPTRYLGQKKKILTQKKPWPTPTPPPRVSRHWLGLIIMVLKKSNTQFEYMTMIIKKSNTIFWYIITILIFSQKVKTLPEILLVVCRKQSFHENPWLFDSNVFQITKIGGSLIPMFSNAYPIVTSSHQNALPNYLQIHRYHLHYLPPQ
jgi:hypothetical protein